MTNDQIQQLIEDQKKVMEKLDKLVELYEKLRIKIKEQLIWSGGGKHE